MPQKYWIIPAPEYGGHPSQGLPEHPNYPWHGVPGGNYPSHGLPGGFPDTPWGPGNPPRPDQGLPGYGYPDQGPVFNPGYPSHGLPHPPHPWYPIPGSPGIPEQGLPPFPSNPIVTVPPDFPDVPSQGPITPVPSPKPPDNEAGWVVVFVPGKGFKWVKAGEVCSLLGSYVPQPK